MAYIGKSPIIGNFVKLDAITAVNGQAAYTMQNGGSNFTDYESVNQFLVSLNGTIQAPTDSFTVSGSTLTFASNLSTGDVIDFIMVFGNSLSAGTPTDATITAAKLTANVITGQTAETSIADSDTILIHDDSANALRKMTKANFVSGVGGTNTPAFEGYSTNGQTPSDATETKVELDGESFDTDSAFDTSTYRFTVPSGKGGKYFVYGNIAVDSQEDNGVIHAYIRIKKNGTTDLLDSYYNFSNNYPRDVAILVHGTVTLSAGDYIELYGYLNDSSGSGLDFKGASGSRLATLMGGYKIIE